MFLSVVFEHLQDLLDPKDSTTIFSIIVTVFLCCYKVYPWEYSHAPCIVKLLTLSKLFSDI